MFDSIFDLTGFIYIKLLEQEKSINKTDIPHKRIYHKKIDSDSVSF